MKKYLLMVLLLVALAANSFASSAREGAQFVLQTKDGQTISGELLAVKHFTLILKDAVTSIGITVDINDLESICLIRNSKILLGGGIGIVLGGVGGYVLACETFKVKYYYYNLGPLGTFYDTNEGSRGVRNAAITIVCGSIAGFIGGFIGAMAGSDKTISVAGQPETEIQRVLKWLRSKARYEKESY